MKNINLKKLLNIIFLAIANIDIDFEESYLLLY